MKTPLLFSVALWLVLCSSAHADLKKCVDSLGKVTYSDLSCAGTSVSLRAANTSGNTVDNSGLREQVQKEATTTANADAGDRERQSQEDLKRKQMQAQAAKDAKQAVMASEKDALAYANCVRDVDRQGAPENIKAELFSACRTAGGNQRQTGLTETALRDCVRSVERTGATSKTKARQIAVCHGADVKPEAIAVPPEPAPSTSK